MTKWVRNTMIRVFGLKVFYVLVYFLTAVPLCGNPPKIEHVREKLADYISCRINTNPLVQKYPPKFHFALPDGCQIIDESSRDLEEGNFEVAVKVRYCGFCFRVLYMSTSDGSVDYCFVSCL